MARNIELKLRLPDEAALEAVARRALALAGAAPGAVPERIDQDDTFFAVPQGRLKLRRFADGRGELIHYARGDTPAAKASDYVRAPLADAAACDALQAALERALGGSAGRVVKRRGLVIVDRDGFSTRVHLDRVAGLGAFVELEVVLRDGQTDAAGAAHAEALLAALGLADAPREAGAYRDLLAALRPAG
jgi:adenylate cyclase class IV